VEWPRDGVTCACAGLEYAGRCNLPKLNHGTIMRGLERHRPGRTKAALVQTGDCHLRTGTQDAGNAGVKVTSAAHLPRCLLMCLWLEWSQYIGKERLATGSCIDTSHVASTSIHRAWDVNMWISKNEMVVFRYTISTWIQSPSILCSKERSRDIST
jgi:hypothetical protein